jgi:hypothetical protein
MTETRGLVFPFKELIDECGAFKAYAGDLLDPMSTDVLEEAKSTLQNLQRSANPEFVDWTIPEDRPLKTRWSAGESQRGKKAEPKLRAEFSFIWQIRVLNEKPWTNKKHFLLDGKASTVVTVFEGKDGNEHVAARWAAEVGDHQSPGTHFHFQVKGDDAPFFPKSLDIPRLPAFLMSPFLAMEMALGDLFQKRADQWASAENKEISQWRELHRDRLLRFFEWQKQCISDGTGSPCMVLKRAKPPRALPLEIK